MNRAEQFIRDYTRTCSNELERGIYHEWLTPDQALRAVEIAREEIYEWFDENAHLYIEPVKTVFGEIMVLNSYKLINDLKQAIKDE